MFEILKKIFLLEFQNVEENEIRHLSSIGKQRLLKENEILFMEGQQEIKKVFIIVEGRMKVLKKSQKDENKYFVLEIIKENSVFGQQDIYFGSSCRTYSVQARTDLLLFEINFDELIGRAN